MPTIVTHAVVPLAIAIAAGPKRIPRRVALAGAMLAMLPDLDVIGFRFGVAYADDWGHRGATHSLALALVCASLLALTWPRARSGLVFALLFISMASHGLLDMLTDGGLGVALWWPFDTARLFAPWRPVSVSPIGIGFFSARGIETVLSELGWIWLPCLLLAAAGKFTRRLGQPD